MIIEINRFTFQTKININFADIYQAVVKNEILKLITQCQNNKICTVLYKINNII